MTAATTRETTARPPEPAKASEERLRAANVNPHTGLATDYLNHFSEAIMLLEMLNELPECRADFFAWRPRKYDEHFAASKSTHRDVAIAAYAEADPDLRHQLDTLADSMNRILMAAGDVMRQNISASAATSVADIAVRWVKPMIARAGAVINGIEDDGHAAGSYTAPQSAVDALLAR